MWVFHGWRGCSWCAVSLWHCQAPHGSQCHQQAALNRSTSQQRSSPLYITAAELYFMAFLAEHDPSLTSAVILASFARKGSMTAKLLTSFPLPGRRCRRSLRMPCLLRQTTLWQRPALVGRLAFYVTAGTICSRKSISASWSGTGRRRRLATSRRGS